MVWHDNHWDEEIEEGLQARSVLVVSTLYTFKIQNLPQLSRVQDLQQSKKEISEEDYDKSVAPYYKAVISRRRTMSPSLSILRVALLRGSLSRRMFQ